MGAAASGLGKRSLTDYHRFGGEMPLNADPVMKAGSRRTLPHNVLAFSHGRAALAWLAVRRGPFASALVCAYTCPELPRFLSELGLTLGFYEWGTDELTAAVQELPAPCLVLLHAPFGCKPQQDAAAIADALGSRALVVVDAAQTAFGVLDFVCPPGGAVLCCPRKTTALADGALLALSSAGAEDARDVAGLPEATAAAAQKAEARRKFALRDEAEEAEALRLLAASEKNLPGTPHRMTDASLAQWLALDAVEHRRRRISNFTVLADGLGGAVEKLTLPPGVPHSFPILVSDRERLSAALRRKRVFATPLWPDSLCDPSRHPAAADLARRLVSLPVDQRYDESDMSLLAELVRSCL